MDQFRRNRLGLLALLVLGTAAQTGCVTRWLGLGGEPRVEGSRGSVPLARVERLLDSLADRQVTLIADACEAIRRESAGTSERRLAHILKLAHAAAVYDIVTQPQALARLADLYVLIELEHLVWVQEGWATRRFGERDGGRLVVAAEEARRDMNRLADLAMKADRRKVFDTLIRRWRDRNPEVQFITGIRFGALPELQGKSILESASSFFDVINPMEETSESVERSRVLADRAFYYVKRLPKLLDWQSERALDDVLSKPEIREILDRTERVTASVERVSRSIENGDLVEPVREVHATIADARELAVRATEAGKAFEQSFREFRDATDVFRRAPGAPPGRPFDIREYTEAAAQLQELAREGAVVARSTKDLVDHFVLRGIAVLAFFFVVLLLYRLIVTRWIRPAPAQERSPSSRRPPTTFETRYGSPT